MNESPTSNKHNVVNSGNGNNKRVINLQDLKCDNIQIKSKEKELMKS